MDREEASRVRAWPGALGRGKPRSSGTYAKTSEPWRLCAGADPLRPERAQGDQLDLKYRPGLPGADRLPHTPTPGRGLQDLAEPQLATVVPMIDSHGTRCTNTGEGRRDRRSADIPAALQELAFAPPPRCEGLTQSSQRRRKHSRVGPPSQFEKLEKSVSRASRRAKASRVTGTGSFGFGPGWPEISAVIATPRTPRLS